MTNQHTEHPGFRDALNTILKGDLAGLLDETPDLVHARSKRPENATLLNYTAFNGFDEVCFPAPKDTPTLAKLLIDRGADPDATAFDGPGFTPLNTDIREEQFDKTAAEWATENDETSIAKTIIAEPPGTAPQNHG